MHTDSMLFHAFVYLAAAVVSVPIAKRLGMGSVLGYLLAGVVIGPHVLGLVGQRSGDVMHFAEFGVVMMLFLVGLELQPSVLWRMRGHLFGLGGLQVAGTALAVMAIGLIAGLGSRMPLAIGLILAMSSTAFALQSLQERGKLATPGGSASFAVLLFQDLSVIPVLALLPFLAQTAVAAPSETQAAQPGWLHALLVIGAVCAVVAAGRYLLNPVFRLIAKTELRELFTAAALLLVVGVSLLMQLVGLSAALGAFVAGVVLANSEYRHELEADIEPFKGLLLGLFFISVGAAIDFGLFRSQPGLIAGLVVALVVVKFAVLLLLGRLFRLPAPDAVLFSFSLAQGGEFAFVLLSFAVNHQVLPTSVADPLVAVVALSMALTPLLFLVNERWVQPRFARVRGEQRPQDEVHSEDNPVIIAGFGRFGHVVGRLLRANHVGSTVLDLDAQHVDVMRRLGMKVFYGDATRLELLHAAGAAKAKIFVIAIDNEEKAVELAELVQKHFPHLKIYARAAGRVHAYEFQSRGVMSFYRETLGSSLDLGADVLTALGMPAHQSHRAALAFKRHDEASLRELAKLWEDDGAYFTKLRQDIEAFESMLETDAARTYGDSDRGWDPIPAGDESRG
ncbi:potassium transporter [Opitutaceae bacterium EW11]|nr:potassium transporter [Opitutaceae bacterium EW11]